MYGLRYTRRSAVSLLVTGPTDKLNFFHGNKSLIFFGIDSDSQYAEVGSGQGDWEAKLGRPGLIQRQQITTWHAIRTTNVVGETQ